MKKNNLAAISATLLLCLSACGGSSSESRQRNGLLSGANCYTDAQFPSLKQEADTKLATFRETEEGVRLAKEKFDADHDVYVATAKQDPEIIKLDESVTELQRQLAVQRDELSKANQDVEDLVDEHFHTLTYPSDVLRREASLKIFIAQQTVVTIGVRISRLELKIDEVTASRNNALTKWGKAHAEANKTLIASTSEYNALVSQLEKEHDDYNTFVSVPRCVLLSVGDSETVTEQATTTTVQHSFQFDDSPSPYDDTDIENPGMTPNAPPSSMVVTSTTHMATTAATTPQQINTSALGPQLVPIEVQRVGAPDVVVLPTVTTPSTPTTPTIPVVALSTSSIVVQSFFSHPSAGSTGVVGTEFFDPTTLVTPNSLEAWLGNSSMQLSEWRSPEGPLLAINSFNGSYDDSLAAFSTSGLAEFTNVLGSGYHPNSSVEFWDVVHKSSISRLVADENGIVTGQVALPVGTKNDDVNLVVFGTNVKNQPIAIPLSERNVKSAESESSTSTSIVSGSTTKGAQPSVSVVPSTTLTESTADSGPSSSNESVVPQNSTTQNTISDESSTSFQWWILIGVMGAALVAVFIKRRRRVAR